MLNIITIDGPAGVGKGTVCKLLSKNLDTRILNSGEIFRTFAYYLKTNNINIEDTIAVVNSAKKFEYKKLSSNKLYSKDIDFISSKISMIPNLRKITIKIQTCLGTGRWTRRNLALVYQARQIFVFFQRYRCLI